MGGAIATGLVGANYSVIVSNHTPGRLEALAAKCPAMTTTADNCEAAAGADIVFIATRPAQCLEVISQIAPVLAPGALVVTLAPQYALKDIHVPDGRYVARMMPNTAIAVADSMTFVTFASDVPGHQRCYVGWCSRQSRPHGCYR